MTWCTAIFAISAAVVALRWSPADAEVTRSPSAEPAPVAERAWLELRPPELINRWTSFARFDDAREGLRAMAYRFNAPVFARAGEGSAIAGLVRRGTTLTVAGRATGSGCDGGGWYRLEDRGYVCSREGFLVSLSPDLEWSRQRDLSEVMPYRYAAVKRGGTRYFALPAAGDLGTTLDGDYFVTVVSETSHRGAPYVLTAIGHALLRSDIEPLETPRMMGEILGEVTLPIAFVHGTEPVTILDEARGVPVGRAHQHARVALREASDERVVTHEGLALARAQVRVARAIARPPEVPSGARWIHVDLDEQTLVAYEGDRAVYATLVASGKPGFDTPAGTHRIREKYISITMRGADPVDGPYEVEEVPWTMYYHDGFALHGAYWHDSFGTVRSHGCTNLSPHDARWLFEWTKPEVPNGWQGRRLRRGSWVHLTRRATVP